MLQTDKYAASTPPSSSPIPPSYLETNMPDLTIVNDLDEAIHVAFFIIAPTHWKNHLLPGERWTTHLPTLPLHFQARWADRSPPFCPEESLKMGATFGSACAAGVASVITAVTSVLNVGATVPLMITANAGKPSPFTRHLATNRCMDRSEKIRDDADGPGWKGMRYMCLRSSDRA